MRKGKRARAVTTPQSNARTTTTDDQPPGESSTSQENEVPSHTASASVAAPSQPALPNNVLRIETDDLTPAEKAWNGFKAILPIVEKVSVAFPPLQSAVGGLIGVITKFDVRIKIYMCV